MAIPDEDVAKVRAATDVLGLIGEHTGLKRVGRRYVGLCPFHGEKTPSFSVNAEEGLYYCFGCQASGDAISFVRAIEGCDFVDAVERLAARAGIAIRNDDSTRSPADRSRRRAITEALEQAVVFYHERLLSAQDAAPARQYLRSRGYDGEIVRSFRLGFAPAGFDELARSLRAPKDALVAAGLAYETRTNRLQDAFRERVIFPIFNPGGAPIALGGRVLPEELRRNDRDPGPKYRNSPESAIYSKRRTLYGLNWSKTEISHSGEAIVCEGYTDVIGFFTAGIRRAVATCGTALTEEHFRLLSRFTHRVVLAFDADTAGQHAAERLYDWERRHELELAVADLPPGADPAELARTDPARLAETIKNARPFLSFRVDRALGQANLSSPEARSRAADNAIAAVAEHPDELVRDEYLRRIADHTHFAPDQLRTRLERARSTPRPTDASVPVDVSEQEEQPARRGAGDVMRRTNGGASRAERDALALAVNRPGELAPFLDEALFFDPVNASAFRALKGATELHAAIAEAEPEAADLLRRLAVADVEEDGDGAGTFLVLCRLAAERALRDMEAMARRAHEEGDEEMTLRTLSESRWLKEELEQLRDPLARPVDNAVAMDAAGRLLAWLRNRSGEHG